MKQKLFISGFLVIIAVLILVFLNLTNGSPNREKNGFTRKFNTDQIRETARLRFDEPVLSVCGQSGDSIFFSTPVPGRIILSNVQLNSKETLILRLPFIDKLSTGFITHVQFPYMEIFAGNAKCRITANLLSGKYELRKIPLGPFTNGVSVNGNTFIVRAIDTQSLNAAFKKIDLSVGIIKTEDNLSEKLGDAGFTRDGQLTIDRSNFRLFYVCFYNNQLTCFDTALHLLYKTKTLDTTNTGRIQILKNASGVTHGIPAVAVNSGNCPFEGILYVKSKLKADNEDEALFNRNTVIDRYDEITGAYCSSMYVPFFDGKTFNSFQVISNKLLIAIYDQEIVCYSY